MLYASDFSENADGWKPEAGRRGGRNAWVVEDGAYRQDRTGFGMSYFGEEDWSDYTLTLKARKLEGNEGFLIVFGRKGGDRFWWNLGGWNNGQHGIEFNQTPVGRPVRAGSNRTAGMISRSSWRAIASVVTWTES